MILNFKYYNDALNILQQNYQEHWNTFKSVLEEMPTFFKASDQRNRIGQSIFDPKATNFYIKNELSSRNWEYDVEIPEQFKFLGKEIDFEKAGIVVEVQFSNYPFLLNNVIRSELFFRSYTRFSTENTSVVIIVTKAGELPASNSTLYYEQAEYQLESLRRNNIFNVPMALVGLFPPQENNFTATWTEYDNPRYSRTIESQREVNIERQRQNNSTKFIVL